MLLPGALLFAALFACRTFEVPLGQGSFRYLYSPFGELKLFLAFAALPGIGLVALAVRRAGREDPSRLGTASAVLATLGVLWLGAWTLFCIPRTFSQHYLNFTSPSHDGAFVLETLRIPSASAYVRQFPEIQTRSIEKMLGTRVLSNPPGMTVLALIVRDSWPEGFVENYVTSVTQSERDMVLDLGILGVKLAMVCAVLWLAGMVPIYLASRRLLPPAGSLAVALVVIFAPSVMDFAPGKDTAQLLLSGLQLLGALMALPPRDEDGEQHPLTGGALLGFATGLGLFFGLILAWTAIPPAIFVAWQLRRELKDLGLLAAGTAAGLAASAALIYFGVGYNLITGSLSVARTWAAVQPQIHLSRSTWMVIGLPIVLLFIPAGLISAPLLRRGITRRTTALLAGITLITLGTTYLVGIPYELPRLWVPFLPAAVLGAFLTAGPVYAARRKSAEVAALLVALSILSAALHRTQLDPREAEARLKKLDPLN